MSTAQRKEAKALFLESLKHDPNISLACDKAMIGRTTAYQWREKDKNFARQWEEALERCKDVARSSIYQRGILGWDEPVISMGQVVYEMEPVLDNDGNQVYYRGKPKMRRGMPITLHKWSDPLAALYAKANLPEYRDRQQLDINAQVKGHTSNEHVLKFDPRSLTPEQLETLKSLALDLKAQEKSV
jgi:hypothetical protein